MTGNNLRETENLCVSHFLIINKFLHCLLYIFASRHCALRLTSCYVIYLVYANTLLLGAGTGVFYKSSTMDLSCPSITRSLPSTSLSMHVYLSFRPTQPTEATHQRRLLILFAGRGQETLVVAAGRGAA